MKWRPVQRETTTTWPSDQQRTNQQVDEHDSHYRVNVTDHALISARVLTCLCPRDYAPEVPLLPLDSDLEDDLGQCPELPELRDDIGNRVHIYGVKYINYQIKINLHQEVMYYVTDVRQPVLSANYYLD